jgi:GT2 family glycosyltransferase
MFNLNPEAHSNPLASLGTRIPRRLTKRPHVWIVLLNFNGWRDTIQCIAHLDRLNYSSYSILIVDNGSSDNSVQEIRSRYPSLPLVESAQNVGFGAGNNIGIRLALEGGADFIWLLNNDTLPPPNALSEMIQVATKSCCQRVLVGSVLVLADDPTTIQAWGGGTVRPLRGATKHLTSPGKLDYITAASLLAPRSLFEEIGLFDEHYFLYWEDTDLCRRAVRAGWQFAVAQGERVLHKHSASTRSQLIHTISFADFHFVRGMVRYFRKHSAPFGYCSIAIRLGGMSLNRLRRGQLANLVAIAGAAMQALLQPVAEKGARPPASDS